MVSLVTAVRAMITGGVAVVALGGVQTAFADPVTVAGVVASYNLRFATPALQVAVATPDAAFVAQAGAVPTWLDEAGLSERELGAVVAAIGAYATGPSQVVPPPRGASAGSVIGDLALAMAADSAAERSKRVYPSNTATGSRGAPTVQRKPFAANPPALARSSRYSGR